MESIYKTKWGSYVDLSKIVMIELTGSSGFDMTIYFQLFEEPVGIDLFKNDGYRPSGREQTELFKQDLIDAWHKFQNEQIIGIVRLERNKKGELQHTFLSHGTEEYRFPDFNYDDDTKK